MTPTERVRVASAVTSQQWFAVGNDICLTPDVNTEIVVQDKYYWLPDRRPDQWQALITKIAQLIEGVDPNGAQTCTACRFAQLVAENDVNGLEALLLNLIDKGDV